MSASGPAGHREGPVRILGIDPGLRRTGWGLITTEGSRLTYVASGLVTSPEDEPLSERLRALHDGLAAVVGLHAPDEAAVEETFVNTNARSALKLGHARAVALLVPALAGLAVAEYAANLVKKTVVGAGHADKVQVETMIRLLLPKSDPASADAADALAVAVTHAHHRKAKALAARVATMPTHAVRTRRA